MSDLSFVAGEFPRLASSAREAAEAVRSARPEGGASAFASAMPGTNLSSKMQGVEDKFADQATKTGTSLDEHAESLLAAERDFIAAEEENTKLIGSIIEGHSKGAGLSGHSIGGKGDIDTIGGENLVGHSYGAAGAEAGDVDDMVTFGEPGKGRGGLRPGGKDWSDWNPITGPAPQPKIPEPVKDFVDDAVEGVKETVKDIAEELGKLDTSKIAGPMMGPPSWLDDVNRK